ncbi:MAG: Asp-tRNA(Asn)/Glu-tRNA(Gln) amidotransferase subunit GatC [bacterium]
MPTTKKISIQEIKHLADLARLKVSESEVKKYASDLSAILDYVAELKGIDTQKISPTAQVVETENVFKNDLVDLDYTAKTKEKIIKNSPESQDNLFKVKKVFE